MSEGWQVVCEDCDYIHKWGNEALARDDKAIHENEYPEHSAEVRDLWETEHRLPEELR